VLKNVKRKHNSNFKVFCKVQTADGIFAASITPTNNNLAEKNCNALLVIIQLQRQSFLAFAAANLLNTVFRQKMI